MWNRGLLLVALAVVLPACNTESAPTLVYQYLVRGAGDNVRVSYFAGTDQLIEHTVSVPWTSDEFEGTAPITTQIAADGPDGTRVECVVRFREESAEYGGDGSGERSELGSDESACSLIHPIGPDT